IEVDAYFGELFLGVVTEIANSANVTGVSADQVTNFDIKIRILPKSYEKLMRGENNDISPFRPGMSATVDIRTKAAINVLSVPIQAVTTRSVKNEKDSTCSKEKQLSSKDEVDEVVFLVQDGIAKKVKVETGIQNTSVIEIISGLNLDDEVVVGPYS